MLGPAQLAGLQSYSAVMSAAEDSVERKQLVGCRLYVLFYFWVGIKNVLISMGHFVLEF